LRIRLALGAALLAGAGYAAVFGGPYDHFDLRQVRAEREVESARLDSARIEVARLVARADSLETDSATIERLARERYGLIRPGERLYRFADRPQDSAAVEPAVVPPPRLQ
jgi:cell division protein FtsB